MASHDAAWMERPMSTVGALPTLRQLLSTQANDLKLWLCWDPKPRSEVQQIIESQKLTAVQEPPPSSQGWGLAPKVALPQH